MQVFLDTQRLLHKMIIKIEKYHRSIRCRALLKSGSVNVIYGKNCNRLIDWERQREREREREREKSECPRRTVNKRLLFSLRSINVLTDMREYFHNFQNDNGKFLLFNKTKGITGHLRKKSDFQGFPRFSGTVGTTDSSHRFLTKIEHVGN